MPDEFTRREIDKVASRTLKEARMRERQRKIGEGTS